MKGIIISFFINFLILVDAQAEIEKYFKKNFDKSGNHSMRNIDFIYMINLDQRPEKFAKSLEKLAPYGINPYRFSAVNGWELSLEDINELGVKYNNSMATGMFGTYYPLDNTGPIHEIMHQVGRTYFCHCMARGTIGIVLSHLSILQDAYDSGYQTIWVMEDDIEVLRNPSKISDLINDLDKLVGRNGWDILFTDQDTKDQHGNYVPCCSYAKRPNYTPQNVNRFTEKKIISGKLRKIGSRYGAYSMIIRRSGMKKILNFIKNYKIFLPYDMDFTMPNDIRLFTVIKDIVSTQINAPSDNGGPNYLEKNKNINSISIKK